MGSVKRSSILIRYPGRQKGSRLVAEGWVGLRNGWMGGWRDGWVGGWMVRVEGWADR